MFLFILILLILAAVFGVLGAVLKATAILILAFALTVTLLVALAWWALKRSTRKLSEGYDRQLSQSRETKYRSNEADPGQLPGGRDDRY